MDGPTEYVAASAVRSRTLTVVTDDPPVDTSAVLRRVDASQSAVYESLADLESEAHIEETENGWRPTGRGRVVADVLALRDRADRALATAPSYWATHSAEPVPERFRQRFGTLRNAEVRRAPDADPGRVVRAVADHIRGDGRMDVFAPVYHREYGEAIADATGETRLLLDPCVVTDIDGAERDRADDADVEVRIAPIDIGLAVGEDALYLSAPEIDGGYDAQSELVAESRAAVEWGRRLFEAEWAAADPPERFTPS